MRWDTGGQQLRFVAGQNDDRVRIRCGGLKRLLGTLNLQPDSNLILAESRYPVTEAGLEKLSLRLLEYRKRDPKLGNDVSCVRSLQEFDGRPCDCFTVTYHNPQTEPLYRKSIIYYDRETSLPVYVKNWGWNAANSNDSVNDEDADTLIEVYAYRDLQLDADLSDADFELTNDSYALQD
jgi:hypothetical protein